MEVVNLLLMFFFIVFGNSYMLEPITQIAALEGDQQSEIRSEQRMDVSVSVEEGGKAAESTERRKTEGDQRRRGLAPKTGRGKEQLEDIIDQIIADFGWTVGETLHINRGFGKGGEETLTSETFSKYLEEETVNVESPKTWGKLIKKKEKDDEVDKNFNKSDQMMQERESQLVAGIHLHEEKGGNEEREEGESIKNANSNESQEREKDDPAVVSDLTPPLSTSSTPQGKEIPATFQVITQSQNPPPFHYNVPPSVLVTPTRATSVSSRPLTSHTKVSPQFFPPSVSPNPAEVSVSTVDPDVRRSVFLLEDLLTEVLQSPGHYLKQNEMEETAHLEEVKVRNMLYKPAWKEETAREINTKQAEFIPKVQTNVTPKPKEELKEPHPALKINENHPSVKPVEVIRKPNKLKPTGEPKPVENATKLALKRNKSSPPRPHLATNVQTSSQTPTKMNKTKTTKKSKEKKKKDNKTQKPMKKKKKEIMAPTHFPYFMDNYCPPECACYGRVVQCSDKDVDKVPYGIPYTARYILLMNNRIESIQLDLLDEYVSMEFLVLSNNRLTDGSIEGAFEGIPALKRLYLDRNLLESVPNDLPMSLEELRLDNNHLSVMSEAVWARCPGLLVLSLSNNTLGNRSESIPSAVLSPLYNLRTLNLDHNQLKSVPLGLPLSIKALYFKGNLIEHFRGGAFNGKSELVVLDLSANRLTNKGLLRESLVNATHLESLNLEGNRLKQVPKHLPPSLKTLNLEGNLISSLKRTVFSTLKNLEHLGLARNTIFKVAPGTFRSLPVLHQLDLCHNALRQVPRQLPQALHSVALTHNKIQSVPRDAFCWGNRRVSLSRLVRVQLEHNLIDMGKLDGQAFRCLRGFQVVHFY
ncbi:wu:fc23c09 [Labrus bergylta]|uniref:wu:fc23c09 n=1 Tax=Labrus bergylta TaxID=56723 RepID=UPI0033132BF8